MSDVKTGIWDTALNDLPRICMVMDLQAELAPVKLPQGYALVDFQDGNEGAWEELMRDAFGWELNFDEYMRKSRSFKHDRVKFVAHERRLVATASAWQGKEYGPQTGLLHMVAVSKGHLGKGLGGAVSLACVHHMKDNGAKACYLRTNDYRVAAIGTYLKLGFVPCPVHESHLWRWAEIFREVRGAEYALRHAGVLARGVVVLPD